MDTCKENLHAYKNRLIRNANSVFKITSDQNIKFGI